MNRAIEQAGSLFTGWIHSCLFCPTGADDDSFHHDRSARQNGAEREMRVCHTQPHLVPPMKLVVYDDLPSPGPPPRVTSLPSWMMDGKDIRASRASNRTSTISFKKRTSTISFKKRSTAPIRISAPSDFRRVPLLATTTPGNPPALELSFNTPGYHLPELPQFEDFQLEENRRQTLSRPAKVLKPADTGRLSQARSHHRASSSVHLSRKPVGSGSRRSSLATLEHHLERSLPAPSPLIPHFSTRPSTVTGMTASLYSPLPTTTITTTRPDSTGIPGPAFPSDPPPSAIPEPQTPLQAHLQARPSLPPTDEDRPSSSSVQRPPTTSSSSDSPANQTPPRTGRVTQWLFNTAPTSTSSTTSRTSLPAFPTTWKPSFTTDKSPFRLRSRTLSGSTLASSASSPSISTTNNMTGAAAPNKTTPSPASSTTVFPRQTARPSEDHAPYQPYPTIYESDDLRRSYYENQSHSHSPIGVAF
ncbi:uncharacterized protein BDW47DRAFT_35032 [Aspergillus candidus]|uniref:Uncharacterized protein n=1 Tax=Aspergillus candidus TaxID=41067 RepID=A0A2I2FB50_ASPCN|nr:hypothetical protein BDW47DRAFT_35032 [Aspergillus candidus]PLB37836.1 hypothetical protein BDW47DRAFT_35032 [Aspergillus candidus]